MQENIKNTIKIIQPKPYEEVGASFVVEGWVPKSWLDTGYSIDNRVFLDFIDINGQTFICSDADVYKGWMSRFRNRLRFYAEVQFNQFNADFIMNSQGRITIKLSGHKDGCQLFISIIDSFQESNATL